ncbi:hypothetical protein QMA61_18215 [Streptomyces coelicoflavus]|uniref:hypothetical protein n=1 Tax=Streptomyces coelicoflavus TaxID=285562 RepID=UPI0024ADEA0F|nr:hypothetical protein [Streptomyces coelicoflavus]MDI6518130.1 hypothetical protein [Streptomyces coelicoflavus]
MKRWTVPPNCPMSRPYWDSSDVLWGPAGERWLIPRLSHTELLDVLLDLDIAWDNAVAVEEIATRAALSADDITPGIRRVWAGVRAAAHTPPDLHAPPSRFLFQIGPEMPETRPATSEPEDPWEAFRRRLIGLFDAMGAPTGEDAEGER